MIRLRHRLVLVALLALPLAACKKAEPVVAAKPAPASKTHKANAPGPMRERREYSDMPVTTQTYSTTTDKAIAAEAQRGGPRGEARIFENATEQAELARGSSPKYMNGQFRYYLAGVSLVQQDGPCRSPQLAVRLAVENLHGNATAVIRGRMTFARSSGVEGGAQMNDVVAVPYNIDIVGPFSDKRGGIVYVTARAEQTDAFMDPARWAQIAAIAPSRLKVFFKPEAFYYPDGTQYALRSGMSPAQRQVMTCGGGEGATAALAR